MIDSKVLWITHYYSHEFVKEINEILASGPWRVQFTEISVTDHHYCALLVKVVVSSLRK